MSIKKATYYIRDNFQTKNIVKAPGFFMQKEASVTVKSL